MMTKHKRNLNKNAERMKAIYETPNPEIDAEIEKLLNPINWEERRFELAKSCMQAKLSINLVYDKEELAHHCIKMADEMIKQLKGESDLNETESLTPINQEGV